MARTAGDRTRLREAQWCIASAASAVGGNKKRFKKRRGMGGFGRSGAPAHARARRPVLRCRHSEARHGCSRQGPLATNTETECVLGRHSATTYALARRPVLRGGHCGQRSWCLSPCPCREQYQKGYASSRNGVPANDWRKRWREGQRCVGAVAGRADCDPISAPTRDADTGYDVDWERCGSARAVMKASAARPPQRAAPHLPTRQSAPARNNKKGTVPGRNNVPAHAQARRPLLRWGEVRAAQLAPQGSATARIKKEYVYLAARARQSTRWCDRLVWRCSRSGLRCWRPRQRSLPRTAKQFHFWAEQFASARVGAKGCIVRGGVTSGAIGAPGSALRQGTQNGLLPAGSAHQRARAATEANAAPRPRWGRAVGRARQRSCDGGKGVFASTTTARQRMHGHRGWRCAAATADCGGFVAGPRQRPCKKQPRGLCFWQERCASPHAGEEANAALPPLANLTFGG